MLRQAPRRLEFFQHRLERFQCPRARPGALFSLIPRGAACAFATPLMARRPRHARLHTPLLVLAFGVMARSVQAQPTPTTPPAGAAAEVSLGLPRVTTSMALEEALTFARTLNPRAKAENARVRLAEERAREPGAAWSPRFGATAQVVGSSNNNSATNWLGSRGAVEFPRIAGTGFLQEPSEINWKPYVNTVVGVTGEQRIYDFGRIAAETAAADAAVDAQRARLQDQQLSIDLGVREAYTAVLAARSIVGVARDAMLRSRVHRDEARARVLQGMRSRIEQDRAEADLARFEVGVLRAEGGLRAAQAAFAAAVGVPAPLLDASEPATQANVDVPTLDAAMNRAAEFDPAIREALLRTRAAHERVRAAAAQTRPELWAIGTINGAAGGAPRENTTTQTWGQGAVPWVPDYFVGAVLAWRFYDPVLGARTETAAREEDVAAAEQGVVRQESVARVEQTWVSLTVAVRTLTGLERAVTAARANYEQADGRFLSGLGTSTELADAEALRTAAEVDMVLGRF
ncbi:MAG TPA: TolC family protein, partial [Labilithrix sp.]|nr:TolC family protein [Labilithrix sp.]